MRLHNGLACVALLWLGRGVGLSASLRDVGAACAVLLLCSAAHLANDLVDLAADRVNRPDRPLPAGRLQPATVRRLLGFTWLAGVGMGILCLPGWTGWWILWALAGAGYSILAKGHGWLAPIWTAAVITSCWAAGGIERGLDRRAWAVLLFLFLFLLFRERVKGAEDCSGDAVAGYRLGTQGRARSIVESAIAGSLLLGAVLWSLREAPALWSGMGAVVFLLCLLGGLWFHLRPNRNAPHRAGTLLKVGAFAGLALLWTVTTSG